MTASKHRCVIGKGGEEERGRAGEGRAPNPRRGARERRAGAGRGREWGNGKMWECPRESS